MRIAFIFTRLNFNCSNNNKGLLNIPSFYTESSDGMAIGHMLWLHNCLTAYGMYEFAKDRYGMIEGPGAKWSKKRTFEENKKKQKQKEKKKKKKKRQVCL